MSQTRQEPRGHSYAFMTSPRPVLSAREMSLLSAALVKGQLVYLTFTNLEFPEKS